MNKESLLLLTQKIEWVEKQGHGEVVVKIRNGVVYRILVTEDELIDPHNLTTLKLCDIGINK